MKMFVTQGFDPCYVLLWINAEDLEEKKMEQTQQGVDVF